MGRRKKIEPNSLHQLYNFNSSQLGKELEETWTAKKLSTIRLLWKCFGTSFLLYGFIGLAFDLFIFVFAQPFLFGKIVSYFTPGQSDLSKHEAITYSLFLILVFFIKVVYRNNYILMMAKFGIKVRTALCSFLYRRIIASSKNTDLSSGKILTLITKDIQTIEMFAAIGNDAWTSLVKIIVIAGVLYSYIGVASFVGVGCFAVLMPIQMYLGEKVRQIKLKMCQHSDERLQLLQEVVSGIRLIKMYTWEPIFGSKIQTARKKEIKAGIKILALRFVILSTGFINSEVALYLMLITYLWLGKNINGELLYSTITIFNNLMVVFARAFPNALAKAFESLSATKRLDLTLKDLEETDKKETISEIKNPKIQFINATITVQNTAILENIDVIIEKGLNAIAGPIGSGKTVFLKTILGDFNANVIVHGSVSYSSQEHWLFPASIRSNILFGQDFDASRYHEVLTVCGLNHDLEQFQNGDLTIVEEKGANLSKGQQARINLARAVYKNSDIYLLDDCLAGLDANVARYVFDNCIKRFLNDKLVVFVTHNKNFWKEADCVFFIENGGVKVLKVEKALHEADEKDTDLTDEETKLLEDNSHIYEENQKIGQVSCKTYCGYIRFGGGVFAFGLLFTVKLVIGVVMLFKAKFIGDWVNSEEEILNKVSNFTQFELKEQHERTFTTYSILIVSIIVIIIIREMLTILFAARASISIHKKMVSSLLKARTEFFDMVFLGNILNRFSKDIAAIDEILPLLAARAIRGVILFVGTMVIVTFVHTFLLLPALILSTVMIFCKQYSIPTTTYLKRLDAATKSPVVGDLNTTLEGLTTIKAFKAEEPMTKQFDHHLDINAATTLAFQSGSNALAFVLDLVSVLFLTSIIATFLVKADIGIQAGYVGLAITQTLALTERLYGIITDVTEMENQMTSVERALEYTRIAKEQNEGFKVGQWPKLGKISFLSVNLKYPNNKYVLHDINLTVQPNEKIGIVGRTGAGKSSIISSLFRLYEIEGRILIDDVDIKTVSLRYLRSKISIIPQEPLLFHGTLRDNLDPFGKYSDEEIWSALEKVNLTNVVTSLDDLLSTSLSVGQKQLLCIARAVLRKKKIVVLDEATASVDAETETFIDNAFKVNFSDCTVIIIAHRLQTVLNCDRILVLHNGEIVENDTPDMLLQDEEGFFYGMVAAAGDVRKTPKTD